MLRHHFKGGKISGFQVDVITLCPIKLLANSVFAPSGSHQESIILVGTLSSKSRSVHRTIFPALVVLVPFVTDFSVQMGAVSMGSPA